MKFDMTMTVYHDVNMVLRRKGHLSSTFLAPRFGCFDVRSGRNDNSDQHSLATPKLVFMFCTVGRKAMIVKKIYCKIFIVVFL